MKDKIDFLKNKISKYKNVKNKAMLQSILDDVIVLQGLREHLTLMRTEPKIIERKEDDDGITLNMSVSYGFYSKQLEEFEEELKHEIIMWLVENIDKEEIDYWYSKKEKLLKYDIWKSYIEFRIS